MTIPKSILVPTDLSNNSSPAIHYACDLAKESKATLHLLFVTKDLLDRTDREKKLERLGKAVDAESELQLETVKHVLHGNPGESIVNYARDNKIDLVVMGTHGRTGLAHLTMGSVTESVLRNSPCPVTVLGPHDGENATLSQAVAVLQKTVGDGLEKSEDEGRGLMMKALMDELRIAATSAILMFGELEHREWIKWENGKWIAIEGSEFIEDDPPIDFEPTSETQAIEMIKRARKLRATDIHIDPAGDAEYVIRLRIDGRLQPYCRLDRSVGEHLINQCKTLARLDPSDPFHAQEGRVQLPERLKEIEVRFTSIPVPEGQAAALRILDPKKIFLPTAALGLSESAFNSVQTMLRQGEGLILVTGPTGAGKTTTVYSMLEMIGGIDRNIVSIEDPVEYMAPFVRQISVDHKHGLTMTSGLRTLLRMDPDVLFIGEIRDMETAAIGIRAAGSGKYVFSTLHTRDVASTITTLRDIGIDDRAIAANLSGIINQRLVRKLCEKCKEACELNDSQKQAFESAQIAAPSMLFNPVGCAACGGTGYFGREGVFEVATMDKAIRLAIQQSESHENIESQLRANNVVSLRTNALAKAATGLISFNDAEGIRWLN